MRDSVILLVSCGKRKSEISCQAKDMYNSYRFQRLKKIAEQNELNWYIMSAKYGLLSPNDIIEPYDLCIANCSDKYREQWAKKIVEKFYDCNKDTLFIVLADDIYSQHIVPLLKNKGFRVAAPFANKDENAVLDYVQRAVHVEDAIKFYDCVYRLSEKTGGIRTFNQCNGKMYWPNRGVYFFVDFNEISFISNGYPRIVRVGTHAVSKGAKSTLWHRLKTHKGTEDGGGNHRGSIFRLHVGNAIIRKEGLVCSTWGIGQNASKEIRENERTIEQLVSSYIGQLGVIVVDVDDLPAATSARAFIEKNSIALLSSINASFNFSSLDWLGNFSPRNEIVDSCLWNINYIRSDYDDSFLKTFWQYADKTIQNYEKKRY